MRLLLSSLQVTLPRLKAIITGDIPGFLDIVANFNSKEMAQDNIISRARAAGKKVRIPSSNSLFGHWGDGSPPSLHGKYQRRRFAPPLASVAPRQEKWSPQEELEFFIFVLAHLMNKATCVNHGR